MRDERRLRGLASIHGVATAASTAARIKNVWRAVILKALARPLSPGEIPDPPSSIDILSVGHHARESALVVGQPDAPPLQLLPKDAVLLHEVLDDLLLVAVDPSSEGHEQPPQGRGHGLGRVFGHYGVPIRAEIRSGSSGPPCRCPVETDNNRGPVSFRLVNVHSRIALAWSKYM